MQQYDPITRAGGGVPLLHPAVKLGIALGILFVSFMCFAQSGRLYSHVVRLLYTYTKRDPDLTWTCVSLPDLLFLGRPPSLRQCFADV